MINDATKQAATDTAKEVATINEKLAIARDVKKSDEDRAEAIKFLNENVETFSEPLTLNNVHHQDVTEAVKAHTDAIFEQAKMTAIANQAAKLEEQILVAKSSATEDVTKWNNRWAAGIQSAFSTKTYDQILDEKENKKRAETITSLEKQRDVLKGHIGDMSVHTTKKEKIVKKTTKIAQIHQDSLAGMRKAVADLKKEQSLAVVGSESFKAITEELEKAKKKLKDTTDALKTSTDKEKTGFALLKQNVTDAEKALRKKIAAGEDATAEATALETATTTLTTAEKSYEEAVKKAQPVIHAKVVKQKESVQQSKDEIKLLKDLGATAEEVLAAEISHIDEKIKLTMEEMNAGEMSYEAGVEQIKGLNEEAKKLATDAAANDWAGKLFGPKVIKAIQGVQKTMGATMGVMSELDNLAKTKSQNLVNANERERESTISTLEETAAFAAMTEEEKQAAIDEINITYDEKKAEIEKKEFERNKKMQIAMAIMNGAMAIMRLAAEVPKFDFGITTMILIGAQIAMTAIQVAAIKAQEFEGALGGMIPKLGQSANAYGNIAKKFARGGMVVGKSHAQGGEKFNVGGRVMELEGGEAVINKRSTEMFRPQLSAMNEAGGGTRFAQGGLVQQDQIRKDAANETRINAGDLRLMAGLVNNQKINVTEAQISNVQSRISIHEKRSRY